MKHVRKPAESRGEVAAEGPQMWPPEDLQVPFKFKMEQRGGMEIGEEGISSLVITFRVMMELI
jgi:hypothetical protein